MARALFIRDDSFVWMIHELQKHFPDISETVLKAGADILADEMKENLKGVLSPDATGQLVAAFGITPVKQDRNFNYNLHLGFDGYQYLPNGKKVAFQLLARIIESGAVVGGRYETAFSGGKLRRKQRPKSSLEYRSDPKPFAKPAVQKKRKQAEAAMLAAAEREYNKIISESRNHT
ncbi:MAG: HK97 gp10 family phage protein [Clostridia bacterium]|nr:HK97 gp10 family phage protein [Clostridia bacterium]